MKPSDRQKMCSNCDGRIAYDAEVCPYCGAEQSPPDNDAQMPLFKNQSFQDSLTTLYTPPYSQKALREEKPAATKKTEVFKEVKSSYDMRTGASAMQINSPAEKEETQKVQSPILPILLLSAGCNLFILGLLQLFFSKEGFLKLEWDASYWFIYTLIALPLFFFGFKKLQD